MPRIRSVRLTTRVGGAWCVCAALAAALPAIGAGKPDPASSPPFRDDSRFRSTVTLDVRDRAVGAVVEKLAAQEHLPLRVAGSAAERKIILLVRDRPVGEVLSRMAEVLELSWKQVGDGFQLTVPPNQSGRDAMARDVDLREQIAAIDRRMRTLSRDAGLTANELSARERSLREPTSDTEGTASGPDEAGEQRQAMQDLAAPGGRAAVVVYRTLTPVQIATLRQTGLLRLVSADAPAAPGALPPEGTLSRPSAEAIDAALNGGKEPPLPFAYGQAVLRLRSDSVGPPVHGRLRLRLEMDFLTVSGSGDTRRTAHVIWSPQFADAALPALPRTDPLLDRLVEVVASPAGGARPPSAPDPGKISSTASYFGGGFWPPEAVPLSTVAAAIHHETGLDLIADSYVRDRLPFAAVSGPHRASDLLEMIRSELTYHARTAAGWIEMHSRQAAWDRAMEVPERLIGPWRERAFQAGGQTLDDLASWAAALSDPQIRGLQDYWGWYFADPRGELVPPGRPPSGLYGLREHLRLWASLSSDQRKSALAGQPLPVKQLSPAQRRAFAAALTGEPASEWQPLVLYPSPPPEGAAPAFGTAELVVSPNEQQWVYYPQLHPDGTVTGSVGAFRPDSHPGALTDGQGNVLATPSGNPLLTHSYEFRYRLGSSGGGRAAVIYVPRAVLRLPEAPRKQS